MTNREHTGDWRDRAACLDADPEIWFPDEKDKEDRALAEAICNECPVSQECRDFAERNREQAGIWAGVDHSPKHQPKDETE